MPSTESSVSHDDLVVCACAEREYKVRDSIDAAHWRGELDDLWTLFLTRLEAEKRSDELDLDFDDSALDAAAEAFRYDHDLITAEETEQWLAARGLGLEEFSEYFARQYWGERLAEEVAPEKIEYGSSSRELRQKFAAELILSGASDRLTSELVWRLAAGQAEKEVDEKEVQAEEKTFLKERDLEATELASWLTALGRDSTWFREIATMEAAYRRRRESLVQPQLVRRELAMLRLPLTQFETEVLELESRDAAQEALFCVKEDGMSMEEVAAEGRYPYRQITFLMEDLPPELQQKFLSVLPGEIIEPIPRADGFQLCRITRKVEPQAEDPAIKTRVEQRILDRHFSDLSRKHVERRLGAANATE